MSGTSVDWPYNAPTKDRPYFRCPVAAGVDFTITTYAGHHPDNMKLDCYWDWDKHPSVLAMAEGVVTQHFDPGGIEISHGAGWFSVYLHMDQRAAIGTHVRQGDWVGRADTIGTGAKHLHIEQGYHPGSNDYEPVQGQMVNQTLEGQGPFNLNPGERRTIKSTNRVGATTPSQPTLPGKSPHHGLEWPTYMPKGHYFGSIDGPKESHGGFHEADRIWIKRLQQQLIWLGCAFDDSGRPVRDVSSSWADGKFEKPTGDAVVRARAKLRFQYPTLRIVGEPLWKALMSK